MKNILLHNPYFIFFLGIFIACVMTYFFWPSEILGVPARVIDGDTILINNIKSVNLHPKNMG